MKTLLLSLLLAQIPFYPIDDVSEFSVDVEQYGVLVSCQVGNEIHVGSGVLVKEGVLTAYHVVESHQPVKCESNGETVIGQLQKWETDSDLALVAVKWKQPKPIATLSGKYSTKLRSVGRSKAELQLEVIEHTFDKLQPTSKVPGFIHQDMVVSPAFNHGRSGGGVFNSDGKLVGIVTSATPSAELKTKLGYATHISELRKLR